MENKKFEPTKKLTKADGTIAYVWEGKYHNWDGPALIPKVKEKNVSIIYMVLNILKSYLKNIVNNVKVYHGSNHQLAMQLVLEFKQINYNLVSLETLHTL
jgi:hypothetical protein